MSKPHAALREVFARFDLDGDGRLSVDELAAALSGSRGAAVDRAELLSTLESMDVDSDGTVDFEEFVLLMAADEDVGLED